MTVDLVPSIRETGLPLIEIAIAGKRHLFILDTGASANLISGTLKDSVDHTPAGEATSYSFEGNVVDCPMVRLSYSVGGDSHEASFTVTDPSTFEVFMEESGLEVVGIMGIPFLIEHKCVVDFCVGSLTLIA